MDKLTDREIEIRLVELDRWKIVDEKWLEKKYRFGEYLNGIDFVQKVAHRSEQENHHPFISIDYKLISVRISSWKARGLTDLDFQLAKQYDEIFEHIITK
ncbi:4a-hydroxytetrahydrobiopterin dehydratase [Halalkalibacter akibai]|uniref:4a-hydroxytetrahydrobiopterin dehydratase n=1 Tax=Halalkalibacter akibai (strain ATCC 43226 / DSM 21942 / CIP 109018 / JCM 9157 / 1139) TaxID=1236973 RepID=W4QZ81_HALA3|nr:4a-hydroxytetrahydrobiopterin dehydratase [Halalkalibacter akibai]GAE36968.1 pterin-4-alpha-carbinolamine dehydratase [Halalkalibacter akibai JCM 9157]